MSAEKRSDVMAESIRSALNAEGMEAVKLDMNGHVATLSGKVASEACRHVLRSGRLPCRWDARS